MFFRAHPVETATRALKLALERFDINEELRRRAGRDLRAWLVARGVVFEPSPEPAPGASPEPAQAPGTDAPVVG